MTWTKLGIVAGSVLYLTGCCCCGGGTPLTPAEKAQLEKERKEREAMEAAEKQAAFERGPARFEAWKGIAAKVSSDPSGNKRDCPDPMIDAYLDEPFRVDVPTVDLYSLPGAPESFEAWTFFESNMDAFRNTLEHPDDTESTRKLWQETMGERKSRFIAVLVPKERALPSNISGSGFDEAYFEGAVVMVDLDEEGIMCSAPVSARNSSTVEDQDGETFEELVQKDFEQNLEDAVNDGLKSISDHFSVNTIGFF